jgi:hypothetical protein
LLVHYLRRSGAGSTGRRIGTPGGPLVSSAGPPRAALALNARTLMAAVGLVLVAAFMLLVLGDDAQAAVVATHNITVFPQRDYVSATGYTVGSPATVQVFHAG